MYNTSRKKERKKTNSKLFTKISQQQVNQMARTADQCQPASTLGPSSTMMTELSNICFVLVFECGRPGLQSSTLPLSIHPSRGGRPWIELSENDKSVPLGPVFQLNMQNKILISSSLRSSSKSARLGFTGAIEKAETQRQ